MSEHGIGAAVIFIERLRERGPIRAGPAVSMAAGIALAAFVCSKGVPTLRHDWNWPIDPSAVLSFFNESVSGWVAAGLGSPNAHPTTYLPATPLALVMWAIGPLPALAVFTFAVGYLCARAGTLLGERWGCAAAGVAGIAAFAVFNPWVYTEIVAGHLMMVLAYGAAIGLVAEMSLGRRASGVRLALWLALVSVQLQFFIVAFAGLCVFAIVTRIWLPLPAGIAIFLPTIVGTVGDRTALLATPYSLSWQLNQSVEPLALLGLTGYFTGYADHLGIAAQAAVWVVLAIAVIGLALGWRRSPALRWAAACGAVLFVGVLGMHGPAPAQYEWIVRHVPESGVFRELYDLAGLFSTLLMCVACAGAARKPLGYLLAGAGATLLVTWMLQPPSQWWIGASAYPHPSLTGVPAATRVALLPAFQPLGLRTGGGSGADPDAYVHPGGIDPVNEYLPAYPVDASLAAYRDAAQTSGLRGIGVAAVVARPWLVSRSNGTIGLAAASLGHLTEPGTLRGSTSWPLGAVPLVSACAAPQIASLANRPGACNVFFGDVPGAAAVRSVAFDPDALDPRMAWIDARLSFARVPAVATGLGGALTESRTPHRVEPGSNVLVYVAGALLADDGRVLAAKNGTFVWLQVPADVKSVICAGLCELVATGTPPTGLALNPLPRASWALPFNQIAPWLLRVKVSASRATLVRFDERYDHAWAAVSGGRLLRHVRVDASVNGWLLPENFSGEVILLHVTALLQVFAEIVGFSCVLLLIAKARASRRRTRGPADDPNNDTIRRFESAV